MKDFNIMMPLLQSALYLLPPRQLKQKVCTFTETSGKTIVQSAAMFMENHAATFGMNGETVAESTFMID